MNNSELEDFVQQYESYLKEGFEHLWSLVQIEPDKLEAFSVIGGLLSRQVTLSIQMARSPATWNGHAGPLFLRSMTDLHITLAWIFLDLPERAKLYIMHGLGEEKLIMEHYKTALEEMDDDDGQRGQMEAVVDLKSSWLNSQRRDIFVEVNLGNWAQLDTRKMSIEAGCESLYKFAYKPFSQAAHSMWPHVSVYNSQTCTNPLHRYHLIPELVEAPLDLDFLYRSCKYVDMAFQLFIDNLDIESEQELPLDWWYDYFASKDSDTEE